MLVDVFVNTPIIDFFQDLAEASIASYLWPLASLGMRAEAPSDSPGNKRWEPAKALQAAITLQRREGIQHEPPTRLVV